MNNKHASCASRKDAIFYNTKFKMTKSLVSNLGVDLIFYTIVQWKPRWTLPTISRKNSHFYKIKIAQVSYFVRFTRFTPLFTEQEQCILVCMCLHVCKCPCGMLDLYCILMKTFSMISYFSLSAAMIHNGRIGAWTLITGWCFKILLLSNRLSVLRDRSKHMYCLINLLQSFHE